MKRGELFALPEPVAKPPVDPADERAFTEAEHPSAIVEAVTAAHPAKKRAAPRAAPTPAAVPKSNRTSLSVDVPPSLLRALKFKALEQERTVRELVIELLQQGLSAE